MKQIKISLIHLSWIILVFLIQSCIRNTSDEAFSDSTVQLHTLQPDYDVPYGVPSEEEVEKVLTTLHSYLNDVTPMKLVDNETEEEVSDYTRVDSNTILAPGDFRFISYEWGVVYAGMLSAAKVTSDQKYSSYVFNRLSYIHEILPYFKALSQQSADDLNALTSVIHPRALDDAGSMCAAMIKARKEGLETDLDSIIWNYIDFIQTRQFRLKDGTLARNRPQPNTIWLDDLFMSVPALAQMGNYSGEQKYFDDAVKQVLQFSQRMFNWKKRLYMHGWVEGMDPHPEFFWARANGWALMAKVELLSVLPKDHPGYQPVLDLLRAHIQGLAAVQSGSGFWHQLLDRSDTYLETSATAIYTYSIAKAINEGWIDKKAYGPMVILAWNAVTSKVNEKGQVEGTCVGTGMGFEPAFYCYRPVNVYAAHGYGPVLLAGAEMIRLIENHSIDINDSALQVYEE
jgi:unsaturated rhamnogalacturonyl hydrolase